MMAEFVINDSTDIQNHNALSKGVCGTLPRREPYGTLSFASVPNIQPIPWEEMPDRIADQERNKSSLWHIWRDSKIGVLNQQQTNFCWAFASVAGLMLQRELEGLPYLHLSPSSVACPITGFRNVGGYPEEACKFMVDNGVATTDFVPETTVDRSDFKVGWKESASCNRVTEWLDVGADAQMQNTMLLLNFPLICAHNWWGHAIKHLRLIDRNISMAASNPLRYGRIFLNSWSESYGDGGCGTLEGNRAIADTAYGIQQAKFAG